MAHPNRARSSKPPKPPTAAERWFQLGSGLVREGRYHEALAPLEQALSYSVEEPDAPFLRAMRSFYGLTIAITRRDLRRGRKLCEEAVLQGEFDPDVYLNLARVYLRANRKDLAAETIKTAAKLAPRNPSIRRLCEEIGIRREPVFTFLPRGNPLNKIAGRIRYRLAGSPLLTN